VATLLVPTLTELSFREPTFTEFNFREPTFTELNFREPIFTPGAVSTESLATLAFLVVLRVLIKLFFSIDMSSLAPV
jgi:hypothetical protein